MSTRCQIGFYTSPDQLLARPSALIYRHSDGYPQALSGEYGVVPELLPFLVAFEKDRGISDAEYCAAQALAHLIAGDGLAPLESRRMLGYGVCGDHDLHADIEYYYRVDPAGLHIFDAREVRSEFLNAMDFLKLRLIRTEAIR